MTDDECFIMKGSDKITRKITDVIGKQKKEDNWRRENEWCQVSCIDASTNAPGNFGRLNGQ